MSRQQEGQVMNSDTHNNINNYNAQVSSDSKHQNASASSFVETGLKTGETTQHEQMEREPTKKKLQAPKRDQILDLEKYKNESVKVQLAGNITVTGILRSFDPAMNMILDDAVEYITDELDLTKLLRKRTLGLCVLRGTLLVMISPNYTAHA